MRRRQGNRDTSIKPQKVKKRYDRHKEAEPQKQKYRDRGTETEVRRHLHSHIGKEREAWRQQSGNKEAQADSNEHLFTKILRKTAQKTNANTSAAKHQASIIHEISKNQKFARS